MASGLNLIKKRLVFALFMQLFLYGYTCTSMAMDVWPKLSKEINNNNNKNNNNKNKNNNNNINNNNDSETESIENRSLQNSNFCF